MLVHEFSIREGSGGKGKWNGGCGVVRDLEFLEEIRVSILSEVSLANIPYPVLASASLKTPLNKRRGEHTRRTASKAANQANAAGISGSSSPANRMETCPKLLTTCSQRILPFTKT